MPSTPEPASPTFRLRPEARPLSTNQMTATQRLALDSVRRHLEASLEVLDRSSGPHLGADPNRVTGVSFVDGARGTGKTSVLVSLADGLNAESAPPGWSDSVGERLRRRILWLPTLDLEPLDSATNLLVAVLVRLRRGIERNSRLRGHGTTAGDRTAALLDVSDAGVGAWTALERLTTELAMAWEGNLRARAPEMEPEDYGSELLRGEQIRVEARESLIRALDGVAMDLFRRHENPLFVLPVDDFDLNPARSLDLLRMLRTLALPRLHVVAAGCIQTAEQMLHVQLAGELGRVAGGRLANVESLHETERHQLVARIASQAIRKLIPAGQRVELREMNLEESTGFRPTDADPSLEELLHRLPLNLVVGFGETGERIATLGELLLTRAGRAGSEADEAWPVYTGARVLAGSARYVADLWSLAARTAEWETKVEGTFELLGECARTAIREDHSLSPEARRWALSSVAREPRGPWRVESRFDFYDAGSEGTVEYPDQDGYLPVLHIRQPDGWPVGFALPVSPSARQPQASAPGGAFLTEPAGTWLRVLSDCQALRQDRPLSPGVSRGSRATGTRIQVEWRPISGVGRNIAVPWPVLGSTTFALDLQAELMDEVRPGLVPLVADELVSDIEWLLAAYLRPVLAAWCPSLRARPEPAPEKTQESDTDRRSRLFAGVPAAISTLTQMAGPGGHPEARALVLAIGLLLCPECGVNAALAEHALHPSTRYFLDALTPERESVRQERKRRFSGGTMDDTFFAFNGHPLNSVLFNPRPFPGQE